MIWEPFLLALVLGLVVSAGLYFAYLWPSVEPLEPLEEELAVAPATPALAGGSAEPAPAAPAPTEPAPPEQALASAPDPSADAAPEPAAAP